MSENAKKNTIVILFSLLLICLSFFPLRTLSTWLSWPYPIEYRDADGLDSALAISRGVNIYSIENYPNYIYPYGGLMPLAAAVVMKFMRPSFRIFYGIDLLALLGIMLLMVSIFTRAIRQHRQRLITCLFSCFVLLIFSVVNFNISGTRPSLPGLFCLLLSILIAERSDYSIPGLLGSWFFSFAAFNFKQYFLMGFPIVCLYIFLYRSRIKGLLYGVFGSLGMALVLLLLYPKYPLYINSLFFHQDGAVTTHYNTLWLCHQLIPFMLLLAVPFSLLCANLGKSIFPADRKNGSIYVLSFLCCLLVFLYPLGGHWGNEYTYFIDLPLIFLLLGAFSSWNAEEDQNLSRCSKLIVLFVTGCLALFFIQSMGIQKDLRVYAIGLLAFALAGFVLRKLPLKLYLIAGLMLSAAAMITTHGDYFITKANLPFEEFARFNRDLEACQSVYLAPSGYSYSLTNDNVSAYDTGATFYTGTLVYGNKDDLIGKILANQSSILQEKADGLYNGVRDNIRNKSFDCVTVSGIDYINDYPELQENYTEVSSYALTLDEPVSLMKPKE